MVQFQSKTPGSIDRAKQQNVIVKLTKLQKVESDFLTFATFQGVGTVGLFVSEAVLAFRFVENVGNELAAL